ncbi:MULTISPECIES: hypothetical protein [unclassified Bradyrhizobium]|uniref:hypothetical protein n=1 Tax=unclassified Bradyrhizobium TaxID=2631580 RepID=UPI002FF0C7D6
MSAFARLNNLRYRKAAIFAAVLLGVPLLLRLVLQVPFATMFTLMAFVCIMRLLLHAWPRNPQTGVRRRGWLVPFACVFGVMLFIGAWATQPHFGANVCPSKGFMWTTDFVEEVRPRIRRAVRDRGRQLGSELPAGVTVEQFVAVADQAVDLLKQCVAERDVNYCRYAGSDPNGVMMDAYTRDGPNDIAPKDRNKYRYIKAGLDYDISMVQSDAGESWYTIRVRRFGKPLEAGGKICYLGCWCNAKYGR